MLSEKYEVFINKLLENELKEMIYIDLKPEKTWDVKGMAWSHAIPIPVYLMDLADQIRKQEIEKISPIALLKGLVYAIGARGGKHPHCEYYCDFLNHIDPSFVINLLNDGIQYAEKGERHRAILYFRAASLIQKDSLDAFFNLGRCLFEMAEEREHKGFYAGAMENFEKCISLDPHLPLAHYYLGYCYYSQERFLEAKDSWIEFLKYSDEESNLKDEIILVVTKIEDQVTFEEGSHLILSERVDEGFEMLKSIEDFHDDWWELNFFLGLAHRLKEEYEDAIKYFLKTLVLHTGHLESMNELGMCFLAIGDGESAKKQYEEALKIHRDHPELLCNEAIVYYRMGDTEEALKRLDKALILSPEDEVIKQWRAHISQSI